MSSPIASWWLLLWFLLALPGCVVTRAECDQNKRCGAGERCFQSSGTTSSGFCQPICASDSQCPDPRHQVCASCDSGIQSYCLDNGQEAICRPCTCNPRCPPGSGCVDGVCVADTEGCVCNGIVCEELASLSRPLCLNEAQCDEQARCALTATSQRRGFCLPTCAQDQDCADPTREVCSPCEGELCPDSRGGSVCRPCQCSPSCPEGYGCVDGECVVGAQGCLCRGQACPD